MTNIVLAALGAITFILLLLVLWLLVGYRKLKKELRVLNDFVTRNNKDIAGLCSAAITIDARLNENQEQLVGLQQEMTQLHTPEATPQPYHSVIQKVRSGADINELMQNCGLSRDEAALLIRLHGNRNNGYD